MFQLSILGPPEAGTERNLVLLWVVGLVSLSCFSFWSYRKNGNNFRSFSQRIALTLAIIIVCVYIPYLCYGSKQSGINILQKHPFYNDIQFTPAALVYCTLYLCTLQKKPSAKKTKRTFYKPAGEVFFVVVSHVTLIIVVGPFYVQCDLLKF